MISATGPLPPYQPSSDPCVLLTNILSTLLRIEDYLRPADYLTAVPRKVTAGTGTAYDAGDTYRFPLVAKSISLVLWDEGITCQIANAQNQEWAAPELQLRAPGVYAVPVFARAFRIRAANSAYQATYSLIAADGAQPVVAAPHWPLYNGTAIARDYSAAAVAPHAITQRWSYTVPAGRACLINAANASVTRDGSPAVANRATSKITVIPVAGSAHPTLCVAVVISGLPSANDRARLGQTTILNAGDSLVGATEDTSTDGSHEYECSFYGLEYAPT